MTIYTEKTKEYVNILSQKPTKLFIVLAGFFVANALTAEFMGVKILSLEKSLGIEPISMNLFGNIYSFNLTAGVLQWPVIFIMTDIINEYYGRKGVKWLSYLTAALIAYAFLMLTWAIHLVPADFWIKSKAELGINDMNTAFSVIFGQGLGIIIGSLLAFLGGQFLDVFVFHKIKNFTGEKSLWLRATGSTLFSQLIDSFAVLTIAFYLYPKLVPGNGTPWKFDLVLAVAVGNYIYKFVIALLMTPVVYLVHYLIESYLGHDLAKELKDKAAE